MGQFSDGYWENSRNESWRLLGDVKIAENEESGVVFPERVSYEYKGYSVNNKTLLEYVGDRMLVNAKLANSGIELPREVSYIVESKLMRLMETCSVHKDDIALAVIDFRKQGDYYIDKANKFVEFIKEVGLDNFVDACNEPYVMKDMRKELTAITRILKNTRVA